MLGNTFRSIGRTLRLLTYNKAGFVGFIVVIAMILLAYVGPLIIELDTKTKIDRIYETPSAEHPLGFDHQGRDIWTQIVHGGKDVIYIAVVAALLATIIAVAFRSWQC